VAGLDSWRNDSIAFQIQGAGETRKPFDWLFRGHLQHNVDDFSRESTPLDEYIFRTIEKIRSSGRAEFHSLKHGENSPGNPQDACNGGRRWK